MSNRNIKFELPALKGTELWPRQIQAPPIIRIESAYVGRSQITATQQADNRYVVYNQWNAPTQQRSSRTLTIDVNNTLIQRAADLSVASKDGLISNFALTQRRNFSLSPNGFSSTHRDYGDIKLHYTNLDNSFEIITAHVTVTEQNIVDYVSQQETIEEKREEGDEGLAVVVFHGGNTISYAPMSALGRTSGSASRRRFSQSSWGSDIVKTCQLPFNPSFAEDLGAVYSELAGMSDNIFRRSTNFTLTSTRLVDDVTTPSDAVHEYPIMNTSEQGGVAYAGSATAEFDENGKVLSTREVMSPTDPVGNKYAPFAVSAEGDRYYAFAHTGEYLSAYIMGDQISYKDTFNSVGTGVIFGYELADVYNPYNANLGDALHPSPSPTTSGYRVGYNKDGSWILSDLTFIRAVGLTLVTGKWQYPLMVAPEPGNVSIDFFDASVDYSDVGEGDAATLSDDETFGAYTMPHVSYFMHRGSGVTYQLGAIIFPYSTKDNWYQSESYFFDNSTVPPSPSIGLSCELVTEYGSLSGSVGSFQSFSAVVSGYGANFLQYRGWLHIANHGHLLQAFVWADINHMYLDGREITSLLGVSVEDIQTVLFDIPISQIEQFK